MVRLSRKQRRQLDAAEAKLNAEINAYMEAHNACFEEAFVACGGTIVADKAVTDISIILTTKELEGVRDVLLWASSMRAAPGPLLDIGRTLAAVEAELAYRRSMLAALAAAVLGP